MRSLTDLFTNASDDDGPLPPQGFEYRPDFIPLSEEAALIERLSALDFAEVRMHGVVAKRRVAHFGWVYGYDSWRLVPGPPIPGFLKPWRERAAILIGHAPDELAEILVTMYPPGAGIGWHRDAPMFGPAVVGLSLGSACRFRFRREHSEGRESFTAMLEPRSVYILSGEARLHWQHSIPPAKAVRYSITFRTLSKTHKRAPRIST
jgi:alkylated DNA repair protein (DNA oxidative demethylase)